mgnify:CR=1 FL=1
MNLITLDCEQGSDAWRQARLGIPTASQYKRIMTNSGAASEQATAYLAELIAERITGQPADSYTSASATSSKASCHENTCCKYKAGCW